MTDNTVVFTVERSEVERVFSVTLTDKQWQVLSSEIDGIFYHYLWSDLPSIMQDLDDIVNNTN